jgi:hypothetical protein
MQGAKRGNQQGNALIIGKLEPIVRQIRERNGIPLKELNGMLRAVKTSLVSLTINYPIYEEERQSEKRRGRIRTYINIW